jgi:hypothetical protein
MINHLNRFRMKRKFFENIVKKRYQTYYKHRMESRRFKDRLNEIIKEIPQMIFSDAEHRQ